ncbi:nitroreductase family protein [Neolewinella aurantiaca]|uniref:Nitroreductase family protein n=1 Tax=Neolewinella aurantiaca TaxID=2602767 RepID=A0A5C7FHJ4_9BACT|nr:nitroreductase family protein [Neolewinella aurantiaca]TXF89189.1 nitroreductase family protein [Neolewinella aurantiaca]
MPHHDQGFQPLRHTEYTPAEMLARAKEFHEQHEDRRTVRMFSNRPVNREVIELIIKTASTAPSGANKQPWNFCVVTNPDVKAKIREAAEKEEYENYHGRMSDDWLEDLKKFGTDWHKDFLTTAPYIIVAFKKAYDLDEEGNKEKNYYVNESVGLACGMLISAIHNAGLVTVTHTPSPMNFLQKVLERPDNERPFLLLPVGYPAEDAQVPVISRKELGEMSAWYE